MRKTITAWYARGPKYPHGLTFTSLESLKPPVISIAVASASAVFILSTTRSATTDSAGFLELATLWAHHLIAGGDGSCDRADWFGDLRTDYFQLPFFS